MKTLNFNYSRENITAGILHFGVGNFHRAHLQCYTNQLLADPEQKQWGICGAMLMPQDEALYKTLKEQAGIYSLTVCGRDGNNHIEWIGSLVELLWSGDDAQAIVDKIADKNIKIITLTITEGGYNTDSQAAHNDLLNPQKPQSVFGFVAEGLRKRRDAGNGAITILSCDNLQHNGDVCKSVFTSFFKQQDSQLATWVENNVSFPNSMVDRITPATTPADIERINATLDRPDKAPIYCEDYLQWIVEDNFIAGRPSWNTVGVEFTDNVVPYENMKLSLLNASHTLLSYPSVLMGYRKVDKAMKDENIIKFVRSFMDKDATPYVPSPKGIDLDLYKQTLVERFANATVSDQLSRLCGDGASKFQVYVVPIARKMLANGDDLTRIAFLIAAYRHYLKYRTDNTGVSYDIFEPQLIDSDFSLIASDKAVDFLQISAFKSLALDQQSTFMEIYLSMVDEIRAQGVESILKSMND